MNAPNSPARPLVPFVGDPTPTQSAAAPAQSAVPTPLALLKALRRRWLLATTFAALLSAGLAAAVWFGMPVKYTASVVLHVSIREPAVIDPNGRLNMLEFTTYKKTQAALVTSRPLLQSMLVRDEKIAGLQTLPRDLDDQIEYLEENLKVDFRLGAEFMRISVNGNRPDELVSLLAALADIYLERVGDVTKKEKQDHLARLQKILEQYNDTLEKRREVVRKLVRAVGSSDAQVIAVKQRYALEALGVAKKELIQAQSDLRRGEVALKEARGKKQGAVARGVSDDEVDRLVDQTPEVAALLAERQQAQRKYDEARETAKRPSDLLSYSRALAKINLELKAKRTKLRREIREKLLQRAGTDSRAALAALEERQGYLRQLANSLEKTIERLETQSRADTVNQADIEKFRADIAQMEKTAERVGGVVEGLKVELDAPARVTLWEPASATLGSMARQRVKATGAAGLLGLLLGAGLVVWREARYRRVDSVGEVVTTIGVKVVGTLPALRPVARPLLPWRRAQPDDGSFLVESIDATRTSLLHAARQQGVRVVLVTSALGGEGKTSLSCQLGASLARAGFRTLLIDGDMRRPTAHRIFALPAGPGLSELLRGEVVPPQAVRTTRVPNLWLVPAGGWDQEATQAIAQAQLPNLLGEFRQSYEYIVIDSAPLLPVVDSLLIAQHVDGVVLSVLREVSRVPLVQAALERLASINVRLLGAVVSGAPLDVHSYRYEYKAAEPASTSEGARPSGERPGW